MSSIYSRTTSDFTVGEPIGFHHSSRRLTGRKRTVLDQTDRVNVWVVRGTFSQTRDNEGGRRFRLSSLAGPDAARPRPPPFSRGWAPGRVCWGSCRPREGLAHTPPSRCFCQFVSRAWKRAPWCSARCSLWRSRREAKSYLIRLLKFTD